MSGIRYEQCLESRPLNTWWCEQPYEHDREYEHRVAGGEAIWSTTAVAVPQIIGRITLCE